MTGDIYFSFSILVHGVLLYVLIHVLVHIGVVGVELGYPQFWCSIENTLLGPKKIWLEIFLSSKF